MPAYVTMPKLSDTMMTEGTLVKWLKKEGDPVSIDEDIAEVETDKATMATQTLDEGVIYKIYEGEAAPLGATLALILEDGEEPTENADSPPEPEVSEDSEAPKESETKEASSKGSSENNSVTFS